MAWAELTDSRCYYELLGGGETVVLIPGLGATTQVWDPIAADLAAWFSVLAIDNRGVGRSQARREARTLGDYVADLVELLDLLRVQRAHVIGMSLGGIIAQQLAMDHPDRLDRLVLMSCAHRFSPFLRQIALLLGLTMRRLPRRLFARTMELLGSGPRFVDADPTLIDRRIAETLAANVPRRALIHQLRCLVSTDFPARDYRIAAPTLVLAGRFDSLIPSCYGRLMAEAIPDSRFVEIPDAGHNPLAECPGLILDLLLDFLLHASTADFPTRPDRARRPHQQEGRLCNAQLPD